MKATLILAASIAALSSFAAHADEADASQYALRFQSVRSAADVKAEAKQPMRISNGGTGFIGVTQSVMSRQAVKDEGARSARLGQTARGELGPM